MARARTGSPPARSASRITPSRNVCAAPRCHRPTAPAPAIRRRYRPGCRPPPGCRTARRRRRIRASSTPDRTRIGTSGMRACRPATKSGAVRGIAHRRGRQHLERVGAHRPRDRVIAAHDRHRLRHPVLVQPSGGLQAAAEPQHRLFVEDRHRIAATPSYTTSRTELEPRSTTAQRGACGGRLKGMRSVLIHAVRPPVRAASRTADRRSVQRRTAPESDGLVMK